MTGSRVGSIHAPIMAPMRQSVGTKWQPRHYDNTLLGIFLLFNELFQTELFDSIAYLSQSYAQFLGSV